MEVIIAAAMVGGIGVAVMQIQKNTMETLVTAETGSEITAILSEVRALLSSAATCKATLGGLKASDTDEGAINQITFVRSDGTTVPRYEANDEKRYGQGRIKILGYKLSDSNSDVDVATMKTTHLFMRMYRSKMSTNQESVKRIKIWADVDDSGNIVECRALSASENSIWTRNDADQNNIFYENGNVGIGVSDPKGTFHLQGKDAGTQGAGDATFKLVNTYLSFGQETDPGIGAGPGPWSGWTGNDPMWMGLCLDSTICASGMTTKPLFHISGYPNTDFGTMSASDTRTKRVISLHDDVIIPYGRLIVGSIPAGYTGFNHNESTQYSDLIIREEGPSNGDPDLAFDDDWTNIVSRGRMHISATKDEVPAPHNQGKLFLNPWRWSGDVIVGGGDSSKHNLRIHGSIIMTGNDNEAVTDDFSIIAAGNSEFRSDLQVGGVVNATTVTTSDRRLKKNIRPLENSLQKILSIKAVEFDWRDEKMAEKHPQRQLGVIAQEVQEILPEIVRKDHKGQHLTVEYMKFIPLLIESVKTLNKEVIELRKEVVRLKKQQNQ